MEKELWTSSDVKKFFRFEERKKTLQSLYGAEAREEIPKAERIARGKVQVRNWHIKDIPVIGKKFGFLASPENRVVLCKYIQKGGVLKTTSSFTEAKICAMNGIKTLIIGQDFECSISDILSDQDNISTLDESPEQLGLFHLLVENASLKEVVQHTSIPTLDIIPETHDLVALDRWLDRQQRREYLYVDHLLPLLKDYEMIIFDNGANWNHLTHNAIASSDAILCPLGCSLLAYNACETNMATIFEFQQAMGIEHQPVIMFPTLLDRSSLSQQIYAQYLSKFDNHIVPYPIRVSAKYQEALIHKQTILEYAPSSQQAQDYYDLIVYMWAKILKETGKISENKPINTESERP